MGTLKIIFSWFIALIKLPANLAKVADMNKFLVIEQKLAETQKRLEKAENQLVSDAAIKAGRIFRYGNAYWERSEDGHIKNMPYCSRCFEMDGKLVHLITSFQIGMDKCPNCKVDKIDASPPPEDYQPKI